MVENTPVPQSRVVSGTRKQDSAAAKQQTNKQARRVAPILLRISATFLGEKFK
jgi:hypothetical protein